MTSSFSFLCKNYDEFSVSNSDEKKTQKKMAALWSLDIYDVWYEYTTVVGLVGISRNILHNILSVSRMVPTVYVVEVSLLTTIVKEVLFPLGW